jgi:fucokinase
MQVMQSIQRLAILMAYELEKGNVTEFARLLNEHWELSVKLDGGTTNTCIEYIFSCCEDLIDGKFVAGAGGGGFLMMVLKQGRTKEELNCRLESMFQDSGVAIWDCDFAMEG